MAEPYCALCCDAAVVWCALTCSIQGPSSHRYEFSSVEGAGSLPQCAIRVVTSVALAAHSSEIGRAFTRELLQTEKSA